MFGPAPARDAVSVFGASLLSPMSAAGQLRLWASDLGMPLHPVDDVDRVAAVVAGQAWAATHQVWRLDSAAGTPVPARRALAAVLRRATGAPVPPGQRHPDRPVIVPGPVRVAVEAVCAWAVVQLGERWAAQAIARACGDLAAGSQDPATNAVAELLDQMVSLLPDYATE